MHIDQGSMILYPLSKKAGEAENTKDKLLLPEFCDDTDAKIVEFFKDSPKASPEQFNEFVELLGEDEDDMQERVNRLMGVFVEFLANGRANEKNVVEADVDPEELKIGVEVEFEHTTNKETAQRIAMDHLAELKDYYTRLKKMEEEGRAEGTEKEVVATEESEDTEKSEE